MTWEAIKIALWSLVLTGDVEWTRPLEGPRWCIAPYDREQEA